MSLAINPSLDFNGLKDAAVQIMTQQLAGVVEGANEDLQTYVQQILNDGVEASATGNTAVLQQLLDQSKVVAEINRLRVAAGAEQTLIKIASLAIGIVAKAVIVTA